MKQLHSLLRLASAGLLITSAASQAAVYEFAPYDVGLIYSDRDKVNIGFAQYSYDYEGKYADDFGGGKTGRSFAPTNMYQFGSHISLTDDLSFSLQMYNPYDLSVVHKSGIYAGAKANLDNRATATTFNYRISPQFSVLLGATVSEFSGSVRMTETLTPQGEDISVEFRRSIAPGALAGASFHMSDIALRASLIYQSNIHHKSDTVESGDLVALATSGQSNTVLGNRTVTLPQAVIFDFQTGISPSTLLTFNAQWRQWSKHKIESDVVGELASFDKDATTYKLGLAHQLTNRWGMFGQVIHEEEIGGDISPLAPNDGYQGLVLAASYQVDDLNFIFATEYGKSAKVTDTAGTKFNDNTVSGVAFQVEKFF